jgi:hypothetical protein
MTVKVFAAIVLLLVLPLLCGYIYNRFDAARKARAAAARALLEAEGQGRHVCGLPVPSGDAVSVSSDASGITFFSNGHTMQIPARRVVSAADMDADAFSRYAPERGAAGELAAGERALAVEYRTVEGAPKTAVIGFDNPPSCSALAASISHFSKGKPIASSEWSRIVL